MSEWISVKDRLPEPWDDVLIHCEDDSTQHIAYLTKDLKNLTFYGHDRKAGEMANFYSVTHWMPLPAPPEVK